MLVAKNPPASAGDGRDAGLIPGLGRSLESEMATHSGILAWKIPQAWEAGDLSPWGSKESDTTEPTTPFLKVLFYFVHVCACIFLVQELPS